MKLLKSFSVYVVNNIINAAIPFLLIPVLTAYLSPSEFGTMTNVQVFITFSLPFVLLAMHGAVNTAFFREKKEDFPSYLSSALMVNLGGALVSLILLLAFAPIITRSLEIPFQWILLIPFICLFQAVCMTTLVIFQARKEPVKYGVFQIGMTLLNFGGSVIFIVALNMGWEGRIYGIMLAYSVFLVAGLIALRRMGYLRPVVTRAFIKDALRFGVPLIPHMISAALIQMLDRLMITHFKSAEWNGLYTLAFQLGVAVNYLADAFNKAWVPHLFENLSKLNDFRKKKIVKQSYLFMLFFLCLPLMLWLVTPYIFDWFIDPRYHIVQQLVLPVSCGAAFGGMYYVVSNYLFYTKKTWMLAIVTTTAAALSFGLNMMLIPRYGIDGASYTYIITNFLMFISVWFLANRVLPMPWFSFRGKTGE